MVTKIALTPLLRCNNGSNRSVLRLTRLVGAIIGLLGLGQSSATAQDAFIANHVIDVNLESGRIESGSSTDLQRLFANLAKNKKNDTLVIHFHGGLVDKKTALHKARRLAGPYAKAGAYPAFFVWN